MTFKKRTNNNNNKSVIVDLRKNTIITEASNVKIKRKKKKNEKLPDFSCLKKLIYEQKKDNFVHLFSFNDPKIKEKIDKFNSILENRKDNYSSETKKEDIIAKNFCETSTFGYTFIDKIQKFPNQDDINDLIQHDEEEDGNEEYSDEGNETEGQGKERSAIKRRNGISEKYIPYEKNGKEKDGHYADNNSICSNNNNRWSEKDIFNKKCIVNMKKKDKMLDQLKSTFDEFKINTLTIQQKPIHVVDENGKEKKKLFIFNMNNNNGGKNKNEKRRIQIIYDKNENTNSQGKTQNEANRNTENESSLYNIDQTKEPDENIIDLVNKINDQKESYLYFAVKDNKLLLNQNNDYFSIMMHYLCERSINTNIQMLYYIIMKPRNMDMLLYLILTYYKFSFADILEQFENISINNIIESAFEEISLYDYYYYFFHTLEVSHEQYYMSLELFNGMKMMINKYNFFLNRMHRNSIFAKAKFVLGMGDIQNVKDVFLTRNSAIQNQSNTANEKDNEEDANGLSRKNGTLQYILNTKMDFINYQQNNFFSETHWNEIDNYNHLSSLDKLVYFTKDLYYKFTKKNIKNKLKEITCEQKHYDKVQIIEHCKKNIPAYKKNVQYMNFLGVYSHSFIWQIYCTQLEIFCALKFKRIISINMRNDCQLEKLKQFFCEPIEQDTKKETKLVNGNVSEMENYKKNYGNVYDLKQIEKEMNKTLEILKNYVEKNKIENIFFPISIEIDNELIEKTKYINGTPLNEFIYNEFLSGIDLKLRVFKLKCIIIKIIKIILKLLNLNVFITLKCSRIFLKEDSLILNIGGPLGLLSKDALNFILYNIDETIAIKTYSKNIFYYIPPEVKANLKKFNSQFNDYTNKGPIDDNLLINFQINKDVNYCNAFYFHDQIKLQKAYSYMIGRIFEETLIDTFTGDKFDYLNFDEEIKDFLMRCLEENVEKREPIEKLLTHKCFSECFDLYINIYDDNINSYKNDKEKAIRLKDLNYINHFDCNIFTIPSDHSSGEFSFSDSRQLNTSSQCTVSNS
ncbi:conserved Plasmodium protein, unknown function [Plasmodium berghei]|uniref:Protein kinase n=2 Tax=Plasmodium berghei TaxID=5821 RepID=A0A509AR22_PLABA|nr:conserved Plasmodium protein, unknown function [Plasmodium berghei ANKA]CXI51640.1 conserved Plasmodium protein, unknown function [Plasmodium berghei]SCL94465.1 conserved Plasmodium protein, unknown function [Plasmodium berghei]SCM16032.1 conserved Plasmodium protein, unknown function [Plasmodium berghei]SCM17828.1 conserved Plasmodium protein, unknown function [Plasmodium berghei]SCN26099.1 conserved Plasmodium protein, unknown function [Plasmodium berghei]|eukprot:XP_034421957.1 conserved Plasmodium protein, unknown function [Plasmodium berghei ANKA]